MTTAIEAAIEKFRCGDEESGFFDLIEIRGDVLSEIAKIFRAESQVRVRAFLVKAAWERKDKSVLPFLAEALYDQAETVWQEALDGLVAFSSTESLEILHSARGRAFPDGSAAKRFHLWLEEAIQQVEFELNSQPD